jgi:hypothetical protein
MTLAEVKNEDLEKPDDQEQLAPSGQPDDQEQLAPDEEVIVTIGAESPTAEDETQAAPEWVRELRRKNREDQRRIRELESKLTETGLKPVALGPKPTLKGYDYDDEKYEAELANWFERKRAADQEAEKAEMSRRTQQQSWQEKLDSYKTAKAGLKVKDFDDAEDVVLSQLDVTQQGIIVQGAENPALVVYALGRNYKKAQELAQIKDPVKFAFAVATLEGQLKMTTRKPSTAPEKSVGSTAPVSGTVDSTLNQLREEAEKTGDYSKVHQYKRSKQK